ncbi:prolyl aminopeptidase [Asimina triloba]
MGAKEMGSVLLSWLAVALVLVSAAVQCNGGITSSFVRKVEKTVDMPLDSDVFGIPPGYNAPQQVMIAAFSSSSVSSFYFLNTPYILAGKAVIISWVTQDEPGSNTVLYGPEDDKRKFQAQGNVTSYRYYNYTSGFIHHCNVKNLKYATLYYYKVGIGNTTRQFWFRIPPRVGPDVPYTFGLIGDLGQSYDSNITLSHYESNPNGQTVLFVGDLSYADTFPFHDNVRWDTWGRFVERSAAYQPWIWTAGNHEIDFSPEIVSCHHFSCFA